MGRDVIQHGTICCLSHRPYRHRQRKLLGRAGHDPSIFGPCGLPLSLACPLLSPILNIIHYISAVLHGHYNVRHGCTKNFRSQLFLALSKSSLALNVVPLNWLFVWTTYFSDIFTTYAYGTPWQPMGQCWSATLWWDRQEHSWSIVKRSMSNIKK